ncbi:putative tRNA pseudouridine synthase Pus10 isoform X1 [Corvus moneduloides]|uniref:putative tRNA pseudouridine synthase Pus10 isoform X1 n=1 Tax=Corvus moneduloides TaxID=1196302 RepID=UPI0013628FF2|nr:putative tRNA pseudouridine synthase Pus10 isoform X1 [Corvus moneduloides]
MSSLTEKDRPIVQLLLNAGTCPRCILRFCCVGSQMLYRHPHKDLMKDLQEFLKNNREKEDTVSWDVADPPCKRIRLEDREEGADDVNHNGAIPQIPEAGDGNAAVESSAAKVCNVCLGILQEFCEADFVKKVCQKVNSADYQFTSFVFSVSLPPQLSVRERAAWLGVKQEMRNLGLPLAKDDIVQLKEAYKWIIHPQLSEELGVPADGKSLFEVSVVFAHPETDEECHFLATACPDCFKPAKNKQSVFTRMAVIKALEKIKEEDFLKHFPCPPSSPKKLCDAPEIQCNNGAVFVAGRYNKYSRNLPQTPWIIDGERKLESSVEELISEHLMAEFKADSFNFSSSGREDVDVRTLGNGRPFAIELVNPRRIHFTAEEMKRLQQAINDSSDKIQVRDLQLVTREAIGRMKEGEEEKTKTYSALIWTDKAIQREDIAFLDDIKELKLEQKTPLRVLHRRPLAVRCRLIHTMRSEYIDEHHFRLHLKTQAGTYPWCPDTRQVPNSLLMGVIGIMGSCLLWWLRCCKIPALPQWCCCTVFAFRSQFHTGVFIKYVRDIKIVLLKNTLQLFLI